MKVTDKDRGFKALQKRLKDLAQPEGWGITVGVHDDAGTHTNSTMSVADVALIHEFGAPAANIPRRSFIGSWFDENGKALAAKSSPDLAAYLKGTMAKMQVLARAGARAVGGIQQRISRGGPYPDAPGGLKPATIKRKGSSVPLIDLGQLRTSVTWAIKK